MKLTVAACAAVLAVYVGFVSAQMAPRGSVDFHPSPENPVGWRGDGSGRYPGAKPPLHWGREAKAVKELRCQAAKPKDGETGQPMQLGVISEWLVAGPFDLPADYPEDSQLTDFVDSLVPDAKSLRPDTGEELAGKKWKTLSTGASVINWGEAFNRDATQPHPPAAIFAHTYVYSPSGGPMDVQIQSLVPLQCLVNGKTIFQSPKSWTHGAYRVVNTVLIKGWNSVLLKISPHSKADDRRKNCDNWYSCISFFGAPKSEYETHNLAWIAKVPGGGG